MVSFEGVYVGWGLKSLEYQIDLEGVFCFIEGDLYPKESEGGREGVRGGREEGGRE